MVYISPKLLLAVHALALAPSVQAANFTLTGSYTNTNQPASTTGRCAPSARTVNIGPSFGSVSGGSNLGIFTPTASHCINPPLPAPYTNGLFSFDFGADDLLTGSYDGALTASSNPTVFTNLQNYLITGGTGRFLNAAGSFTGTGTVTFAPNQLPFSTQVLSGNFSAGAVPEAATWIMMLLGFGAVGSSIRWRRIKTPLTRLV